MHSTAQLSVDTPQLKPAATLMIYFDYFSRHDVILLPLSHIASFDFDVHSCWRF